MKFRNTTAQVNADALSCLPLPVEPSVKQPPPEIVLLVDHLDNSPVIAHQIQECTCKDPQLALIVQFVQQGWPSVCPDLDNLVPFFEKRTELSIYQGCLLWVPELSFLLPAKMLYSLSFTKVILVSHK